MGTTSADLEQQDAAEILNGTGSGRGRTAVFNALKRTRTFIEEQMDNLADEVPDLVPVTDFPEFDSALVDGLATLTINPTKLKAKLSALGYTPGGGGAASARPITVLLIGQSLADGQKTTNNPLPAELVDTNYGVSIFKRGSTNWEPMKAGYNTGCYDALNWGPEVEMGRLMVGRFGPRIRIIKFAKGGTQLAFSNNADEDWSEKSTGELLDQLKACITAAMAALGDDAGPIDAVVWKQGEADAYGALADAYGANLGNLFNNLWAWLGYQPALVLPQLTANQTALDATGRTKVMAAQVAYARDPAHKAVAPSTDTVVMGSDGLHPQSPGFKELGRICFEAAIGLLTQPVVSLPTPAAPTAAIVDDTADTMDWTNTPSYSAVGDYEYTLDGGSTIQAVTAKPLVVGNVAKIAGTVGVRVKATANNTASPWLFNSTAFNVTGGGGTTQPLTGTNLLASDDLGDTVNFDYSDLLTPITGGQGDYAGGTSAYFLKPNASSTDNHGYHNKVLSAKVSDGKSYVACVLVKPGTGIKYFSNQIINNSGNQISRGNFNINTLQPEGAAIGNAATTTMVAVGGGWYEVRLYWTQMNDTTAYTYGKVFAPAGVDVKFVGDNSIGLGVHKPRIYEL